MNPDLVLSQLYIRPWAFFFFLEGREGCVGGVEGLFLHACTSVCLEANISRWNLNERLWGHVRIASSKRQNLAMSCFWRWSEGEKCNCNCSSVLPVNKCSGGLCISYLGLWWHCATQVRTPQTDKTNRYFNACVSKILFGQAKSYFVRFNYF